MSSRRFKKTAAKNANLAVVSSQKYVISISTKIGAAKLRIWYLAPFLILLSFSLACVALSFGSRIARYSCYSAEKKAGVKGWPYAAPTDRNKCLLIRKGDNQ